MKLQQLIYVERIVNCGGVSKAAEELHISQPSISNAVKELEAELGISLFLRSKKAMILTPEGKQFLERAIPIIHDFHQLQADMKDLGVNQNTIRISISPMLSGVVRRVALHSFLSEHPFTHVDVLEYGYQDISNSLLAGNLDAAVSYHGVPTNSLEALPITTVQMMFCISRKHPLAEKSSVTIEDIADVPLALLKPSFYKYAGEFIKQRYISAGKTMNIAFSTSQFSSILASIKRDHLGSFLFDKSIIDDDLKEIAMIPLNPPRIQDLYLYYPKSSLHKSSVRALVEHIRQLSSEN